jgi:hypothetical protein
MRLAQSEPVSVVLRTITLHQPWASLIAIEAKPFETRCWAPPVSAIGTRIAVHAGLHVEKRLAPALAKAVISLFGPNWASIVPRGQILCTALLVGAWKTGKSVSGKGAMAEVTDCVDGSPERKFVKTDVYGDYARGRWAWLLADLQLMRPTIPARGYQKFWNCELPAIPA